MSDLLALEGGKPPWQPSSIATLTKTYNFYDRPLIGVIEQEGTHYLFQCWAGEIETWHLWVYSLINPTEEFMLDSAPSPEAFDAASDFLAKDRLLTVAIARDGVGIVDAGVAEHSDEISQVGADLAKKALEVYGAEPDLLKLIPERRQSSQLETLVWQTTTSVLSTIPNRREHDSDQNVEPRKFLGEAAAK